MPERRDFLIGLSAMLAMNEEAAAADTIYIPAAQSEKERPLLLDFMQEYAFAMIVTAKGGLRITNVPTILSRDKDGWGSLWWHIARNNPQNNAFDGAEEALVVFHGPHSYISPNWYPSKHEAHRQVPTWNYEVVHAHGTLTIHDDDRFVRGLVARLTRQHEASEPKPWKMTDSAPEFI
ncbi:MAG: FMN-binding negative transcriptional regulator, partial [Acidobacteria bacterium]|nr:FMN-binding negative transcriptional regulator [Acidobacteriota bacterium]